MSPKRKDPPEPFQDGGWVGPDSEYETEIIKVKAPYIYADALCNCRVRLDLGPCIVEREVRRAKKFKFLLPSKPESRSEEDLARAAKVKYESFKRNFEGMVLRYATLKKNPKPAEKDRRTMLEECEKAARKLKDKIELDDFSIDLIYGFSSGGDYAEFKKSLERFVKGISAVVRETEPIRLGPKVKKLNAAAAEEIRDMLEKYGLEAKKSDEHINCK